MEKRVTKNAQETQALGEEIAASAKGGEIFALYGDLGSGKTTFVQGFAKGLGITQRIVSPTFIIMREYEIRFRPEDDQPLAEKKFYHVDLYRTNTLHDIEGLGLSEIMTHTENIVVIEWPEKLAELLPKHVKKINFSYLSHNEREIIYG